jgi:DNA-binding Lrp family transcriptional regulator
MNAADLDATDRTILDIMRRRGRVRNNELAALIGLSQSACLDRVRKLERCGYILGYAAILSEAARDGGFEAWVEISLAGGDETLSAKIAKLLTTSRHVLIADRVSGAGDWMVRFSGRDAGVWKRFCSDLERVGLPAGGLRMSIILDETASTVTSIQDIRPAPFED